MTRQLRGIIPILPSPFAADGSIDKSAMKRVTRFVLDSGAHGVAFPALASEFYSLTDEERLALTEVVVQEVGGAVPVVGTATSASSYSSVELAKRLEAMGVDALMVMPPYVVRDSGPEVLQQFKDLSESVDLPLIVQNAPAPLGSAFPIEFVRRIIQEAKNVHYVKEECTPGGQRITKLLQDAPPGLKGVFGGAGGRALIDELNRGAIGAMPACELTKLHVKIFELHQASDVGGARTLYNKTLPLLTMQAVFRMNLTKEMLVRNGIIASAHVRAGSIPMDEADLRELSVLTEELGEEMSS